MTAAGEGTLHALVVILTLIKLANLSVGDHEQLVGRPSELCDHIAAAESLLNEALCQSAQGVAVVEAPEQWQLAQFLGNDTHVITGAYER